MAESQTVVILRAKRDDKVTAAPTCIGAAQTGWHEWLGAEGSNLGYAGSNPVPVSSFYSGPLKGPFLLANRLTYGESCSIRAYSASYN